MSETELRDELALERTRLANERTLLAYVRTALALAAAGAAVLHFYAEESTLVAIAWLLIVGAVVSSAVGTLRFLSERKRIEQSGMR